MVAVTSCCSTIDPTIRLSHTHTSNAKQSSILSGVGGCGEGIGGYWYSEVLVGIGRYWWVRCVNRKQGISRGGHWVSSLHQVAVQYDCRLFYCNAIAFYVDCSYCNAVAFTLYNVVSFLQNHASA